MLYANDLVIYMRDKNTENLAQNLQTAINTLEQWCKENGLRFSATKTKAIHFCKKRRLHDNPALTLNGTNVQFYDTVKCLGVTFDRKLSWILQIKSLKTDCQS